MPISESVPEWITFPFPLGGAVWPAVLLALASALKLYGVERLEVMHGWTESELNDHPAFPELQWQTQAHALSDLRALIQEGQTMGMRLGRDDLFLEGENPVPWQILLCHEGYVHVKTQDESLTAVLQGTFSALGIVFKCTDKEAL